jgi:hypothetical protein
VLPSNEEDFLSGKQEGRNNHQESQETAPHVGFFFLLSCIPDKNSSS